MVSTHAIENKITYCRSESRKVLAETYVLDEATSQVDLESEQVIHQVLEQFVRGRTAIIITHRMSTLALADRIAVMNAGHIIDVGTHEQLIGRCDLYRRLYQIQFREAG